MTPKEVSALVDSLMHTLVGVNADARWFIAEMDAQARRGREHDLFAKVDLVNGDLWDARTFASRSKSPNKFAMRREQIGQIDKALAAYHRAGAGFTRQNFETKLSCLVNMIYYICDHRRAKPRSDRRVGVDSLGVQIVKLLNANPIGSIYGNGALEKLIADANRAAERRVARILEAQQAARQRA